MTFLSYQSLTLICSPLDLVQMLKLLCDGRHHRQHKIHKIFALIILVTLVGATLVTYSVLMETWGMRWR